MLGGRTEALKTSQTCSMVRANGQQSSRRCGQVAAEACYRGSECYVSCVSTIEEFALGHAPLYAVWALWPIWPSERAPVQSQRVSSNQSCLLQGMLQRDQHNA